LFDERGHFRERRRPTHRAKPRHAHGRGGIREAQDLFRRPARQHAVDEPGSEHIAGPCGIDSVDRKCRGMNDPVTVERHRAVGPERDAQQALVEAAELPQRALGVAFARQQRREMFREDRDRDTPDELRGAVRHAIEIARDDHAGLDGLATHPDRRFLVHIVHVEHPRLQNHWVDGGIAEHQPRIAVPEYRPLARGLIHQHHGELVVRLVDDDVRDVHVADREILEDPPAVRIVADRTQKTRAEPKGSARGEHRGHLAAAGHEVVVDPKLRLRGGAAGRTGEEVYVVYRACAESDDIH
jgi:hypothetical protein